MMADPRFSSKPSGSMPPLSISLGWRVLLLCSAFIILPLLLYGWLMYRHFGEIKRQAAFIELGLFVEDQEKSIEGRLASAKGDLHFAKVVAAYLSDSTSLSEVFHEVVKDFSGGVLLLAKNDPVLGWINVASSEKTLVDMRPPCDGIPEAEDTCIWQNHQMIVLTESFGENCRVLFLFPVQGVIFPSHWEQIDVQLFCRGKIVGAPLPLVPDPKALIIPYEQLLRIAHGREKKNIPSDIERIATRISIDDTPYEILITIPLHVSPIELTIWRPLSLLILVIAIIGGALVWWLTHYMARPLKNLARVMHKVEDGIYDVRYNPEPFGFEVNGLGNCFNHMLSTMLENIREVEKQKIDKEILTKELAIGHEIQKSLFPRSIPTLPHLDIATLFYPAKQVAGDFYDLFATQERLLIVIADAAGKGIPACLYSLLLRGILRGLVESGKTLEEVIRAAHKLLQLDSGKSSMFITAWVGLMDLKSMELHYASLGHYPAIFRHQNTVEELGTEGSALGIDPMKPLVIAKRQLSPGDFLFLYTDGLAETAGNGPAKLLEQIKNIPMGFTALQLLDKLEPSPPFEDDITLVAMKIT